MLHSANWDDGVVLEGKRVGVIGGGSSAVQIVPNIQPHMFPDPDSFSMEACIDKKAVVGEMKCFIRSAAWITASFGQRFAGKNGANFKCK